MVNILLNWSIHYITKATSSMKHTELAKNYIYIYISYMTWHILIVIVLLRHCTTLYNDGLTRKVWLLFHSTLYLPVDSLLVSGLIPSSWRLILYHLTLCLIVQLELVLFTNANISTGSSDCIYTPHRITQLWNI